MRFDIVGWRRCCSSCCCTWGGEEEQPCAEEDWEPSRRSHSWFPHWGPVCKWTVVGLHLLKARPMWSCWWVIFFLSHWSILYLCWNLLYSFMLIVFVNVVQIHSWRQRAWVLPEENSEEEGQGCRLKLVVCLKALCFFHETCLSFQFSVWEAYVLDLALLYGIS